MQISVDQLREYSSKKANLKKGCIVDTNVLFAAAYDLDPFHEWASDVFEELRQNNIPAFTNLNVRSEFIELNRRVFIAEGLMVFYKDWRGEIELKLSNKLKSLETRIDDALKEKRVFKLSDQEIKQFKFLINENSKINGTPSWTVFCVKYFEPYITAVWDQTVSALKIQFLGTREIESNQYFDGHPKWEEMLSIVGRYGIGTADAMIINLYLKSKLSVIATADLDVRDTVVDMASPDKFVLAPS